jgi:DNA repair exonuclease SbcCD ATPase subunit
MRRRLSKRLEIEGYQPDLDIRSSPGFSMKPVLLISGESGAGKT